METSPIQNHVRAADLSMEKLAASSAVSEKEKVGELSRQFEAVLLREILTEAQKTQFRSKYNEDSYASGIYRDMVTNQLADSMSKSGAVGLGKQLAREISRQHAPTLSPTPKHD